MPAKSLFLKLVCILVQEAVEAGGGHYHLEHFACDQCQALLYDNLFFEHEKQVYCEECNKNILAPRCAGCKNPVLKGYINALDSMWHTECFCCVVCKKNFNGKVFHVFQNQPYCEQHYHEKRGSVCATCKDPIVGGFVNACGQKFHPEHFICSYCKQKLSGGTYKVILDKVYCSSCSENLGV